MVLLHACEDGVQEEVKRITIAANRLFFSTTMG